MKQTKHTIADVGQKWARNAPNSLKRTQQEVDARWLGGTHGLKLYVRLVTMTIWSQRELM